MSSKFVTSLLAVIIMTGCIPSSEKNEQNIIDPITVEPNNLPPIAAYDGFLVVASGETLSSQVQASDPENDTLLFTATNLPTWINLNSSDGQVTASPTSNDIGVYRDIRLTVSDSTHTVVLGPYTIEVVDQLYSVDITWQPTLTNEDDEPIENITGYKIQWGPASGVYTNSIKVSGQLIISQTITRLHHQSYYFSMIAIDSSGQESNLSDEHTFNIGT